MTTKDKINESLINKKISVKISEQDEKVLDLKSALEKRKVEELEVQKIDSKKSAKNTKDQLFKIGSYAIYPSHGVGKIINTETITVANQEFTCYLMNFEAEKLLIKIPVAQAKRIGLRGLSTKDEIEEVFTILRSGVKKLKGMWSRRAQEYETKINSGDIIMLAEVLRDLTRDIEDGERSYSERIIYETAIYRLSSEYAAIYNTSFEEAKDKVISIAKDKIGSFDVRNNEQDDDFDSPQSDDEEDDTEEHDEDDLDDDHFDESTNKSKGKSAKR